jgi:hypothetical protein
MRIPIWAVAALVTVLVFEFIINGYIEGRWAWEGSGFSGASLWDWLDLLIVPLILGIGGIWFQRAQRIRELESQESARQRELEMETRRREREQITEEKRAQDAALQAYLEQIGRLLIRVDLRADAAGGIATLARAYTLTALERVGSTHKRSIVRFLFEAGLISAPGERVGEGGSAVVHLFEADLSEASLSGMRLAGIRLGGTNLRKADLSNTHLANLVPKRPLSPGDAPGVAEGKVSAGDALMNPLKYMDISVYTPTDFSTFDEADLRGADLRDSMMAYCSFRKAKLRGADLRGANLRASRFLAPTELKKAIGDQNTLIHENIERPETWNLSYAEQIERLKDHDGETD